jgi:hypothetical protein
LVGWLISGALGAAAMALFDPRRGAVRRARVRDRGVAIVREAAGRLDRRSRDLRQRLRGIVYEAKDRLHHPEVPDDLLVERVRAQMGRPVSHPRALEVEAKDGCVILRGPILAEELNPLLDRVQAVRGVRSIESHLDVHITADVPALRG